MTDEVRAHAHRMLSRIMDPMVLRDHGMTVGLMEVEGAGLRVATWDGYESRHMSAAAARRLASELIASDQSVPLRPVHDALMAMVDKIEAQV